MKSDNTLTALPVWNEMMSFVKEIYTLSRIFPVEERDGLGLRLRTKVVDLPMAFAKALNEKSEMNDSQTIIAELETLLLVCYELRLVKKNDLDKFQESLDSIGMQINQLNKHIAKNAK